MTDTLREIGLPPEAIQALQAIFKKNNQIEKVILYGSRAKGNYQKGSDVDLCIIGETLTYKDLWALENQLDDLLLPWKIDLTLKHVIDNPELLAHIKRVGVIFYTA